MARPTSFNFDSLLFTGPLTDRRIEKYIRDGYYGKDWQDKMRERDKKRNKASRERSVRKLLLERFCV